MAPGPIQIYAELLPNIRQVSVSVTLPSAADASTVAEVLADGTTLRIRHGGHQEELTLPGRVAAAGSRLRVLPPPSQQQPGHGRHCGSAQWRLPLAGGRQGPVADGVGAMPWSAPDLRADKPVVCRSCSAELVPAGSIHVWKDLPSDNWAEMMEFWHCHKPDHKHDHPPVHGGDQRPDGSMATEGHLAARGYGANSAIAAQAGVGFVDLIALVFAESDCRSILFSKSHAEEGTQDRHRIEEPVQQGASFQSLNLFCASCRAQIGYFNFRMLAVTLFKWRVQCDTGTALLPSISECLSATLIATTARSGSSKSLIMPIYDLPSAPAGGASATHVVHIWMLNSNIRYASSQQQAPKCAIKLLYKFVSRTEADAILEKLNSDVQEINLPDDTIAAVIEKLKDSNNTLPASEKLFKEWKIGLLDRWEPTEWGDESSGFNEK